MRLEKNSETWGEMKQEIAKSDSCEKKTQANQLERAPCPYQPFKNAWPFYSKWCAFDGTSHSLPQILSPGHPRAKAASARQAASLTVCMFDKLVVHGNQVAANCDHESTQTTLVVSTNISFFWFSPGVSGHMRFHRVSVTEPSVDLPRILPGLGERWQFLQSDFEPQLHHKVPSILDYFWSIIAMRECVLPLPKIFLRLLSPILATQRKDPGSLLFQNDVS